MASAVQLRIQGRVQGVWYRASTRDQAVRLGVSGWVRNRSDGSVEVLAEGEEPTLRELVEWCRLGPRLASVTHLDEHWGEASGGFEGFEVRPSE